MTVRGGGGNDTMLTGSGNDYVEGGDGDDHIEVNAGDDRVYGDWEDVYYNPRIGTGHDTIQGGAGNDTLYGDSPAAGGTGNDVLDGGEGVDSLYGYGGDDVFRISSSAFTNVTGDAGFDRLQFLGRNLDLDLVNTAKVTGIEEIDVSGTGVNGLLLNQSRVVALSDSTDALIVRGNVDDSVWTSPGIVGAGGRVGNMPTSPEHDWDREEDVRDHQFREACDSVAIAPDRRTFTQHFEKQVLVMGTRNGQRVGEIICGWVCM